MALNTKNMFYISTVWWRDYEKKDKEKKDKKYWRNLLSYKEIIDKIV